MKKGLLTFFMALSLVGGLFSGLSLETSAAIKTEKAAEQQVLYLSDLDWEKQSCGSTDFPNGTAKDTAVNGSKMQLLLDGQVTSFEKGLGTHAPSEIVYDIEGMGCTLFEAYVGVDYQCLEDYQNLGEGIIENFAVEIDGKTAAKSGEMNPEMDAYHFQVDIPEGASELVLKTVEGDNNWSDWVIWADAKITAGNEKTDSQAGLTVDPISVNDLTLHIVDGKINLYFADQLIAQSASLGSVSLNGKKISDFAISEYEVQEIVDTDRGQAVRLILKMSSKKSDIVKVVYYDLLEEINGAIYTTTFFESSENVKLTEIIENEFTLVEPDLGRIWSYNGGGEGSQSYYDTLQKINSSFYRENKQDDTAAGIPVADIYSVNGGITVGDGSLYRRFLSTPVQGEKNTATVSIKWQEAQIKADKMTEAGTAIIGVHLGDYYCGLRTFANVMAAQGFAVPEKVPESSYELRWESWGWEGAWTVDKILGKLDELYAQGIRQITLDDCWYTAAGDWELNPDKFPNGTKDMKRLTDAVHEKGMTIILWWRPMDGGRDKAFSVISGHTQQASKLLQEHPEYFVKNEDGSFAKLSGPGNSNSFNGSTGYALCPYSEGAVKAQTDFVRRAMTEWGIDGFKSDYVWGMPQCYNEEHAHVSSRESTENASEIFYKAIYEEMISINPEAFHLLCNCGTPQDYYSFPYVTQIPTADPTSVDQTRRRVKAYKALAGDEFPITTDHNEIWYPSSVGTGAILIEKRDFADGSSQEKEYYKWLEIANEHQLYKGTHIGNLYSYGIDDYETYVIEKDGIMYYSFYKDGKYAPVGNPDIVLKGLNPNITYQIEDYVNGRILTECVAGDEAVFAEKFDEYLLIRAIPLEELADYTAVDEALAKIPWDLTPYTAESVQNLNMAVDQIVRDLGEKSQTQVDEMAKAVISAVNALKYGRVNRIFGKTRFETSFALAEQLKKELKIEKFENIIIASGSNFADALSGSYLSAVKNAPILIVNSEKTQTIQDVKEYIKENLISKGTVYILGGKSAVSEEMEKGLRGFKIKRLAGKDRYGTNLEILKEAGVEEKTILIATGKNFADSLSASAVGMPILLVGKTLYSEQAEFLKNTNGQKIVLGGAQAVSNAIMKSAGATERIGGQNRYETSVLIAEKFFENPKGAVLAYASNFPDGLCGGSLAYVMNSPLLLTKTEKTSAAENYVHNQELKGGIVIGGQSLISDEAVEKIF